MNTSTALSQINSITTKFDSIFNQLDSLFPQLIRADEHSSFSQLKNSISTIHRNVFSKSNESPLNFNEKYSPVFNKLNDKISDLKHLDELIAEIKEDSEQMELIALNAMVISVKSGEKGLAFSRITENLQRLSKDMFLYSDKLSEEESGLLENINQLKTIFSGIMNSQKSISSKDADCISEIKKMLSNVSPALSALEQESDSIYVCIEKTMSVTSKRKEICQKLAEANKALKELEKYSLPKPGSDEELDYTAFALKSYEKIRDILSQISSELSLCCSSFAGNWGQVLEIFESSDKKRMDFESRFLNNHAFGNDNIQKQVSTIIEKFKTMMSDFNSYHSVQTELQATCKNITKMAKSIYSVFESLRPVMSRLHHVRILQQIEVSKNDAIKSVQDSVTDMDNLINSANKSLDDMQGILEAFIQDTTVMLTNFMHSIDSDNEKMLAIRGEKEAFFGDLNNGKNAADAAIQNFTVYPDDFHKKCVLVQQNLQDLMRFNSDFSSFANEIDTERGALFQKKNSLMSEKELTNWEIKNIKYLDSLAQI